MSNKILVGITGGIGSGKSTIARLFKEKYNIPVYFSDIWAKELMSTKSQLIYEITKLLGKDSYFKDGKLNTKYISSIVFNNNKQLSKLNNIVHHAVEKHFKEWVERQNSPYVIYESAILFESGKKDNFDKIITVYADLEKRISRAISRDNSSREEVIKRVKNQLPDEQKKLMSDYIINNNSNENLDVQILNIHKDLLTFVTKTNNGVSTRLH